MTRSAGGAGRAALTAFLYRNFPSAPDPDKRADEETGKFVILSRNGADELHVILSPLAFTPYHANIVFQYLQAEGRGRVETPSASGCRILSKEWEVHGGGHYILQHWLHNIILHGKSSAFGRFEQDLLEPFELEIPSKLGLDGYNLEFK
jgi:hypothetical protein